MSDLVRVNGYANFCKTAGTKGKRMTELIDYAYPLMMAERALKKAHDYLLEEDYILAMDQLEMAIVEVRIARNSVLHIKEKSDALYQQTQTIQERV
jgi:hypothetical protein